jgi:hypothetical protein
MKIKSVIIASAISVLLLGCATTGKMNRLSVGMSKADVIAAMGEPDSTSAPGGGVEYLRYSLTTSSIAAYNGYTEPYFVKLVNGRVDAYGHVGDFGSAQNPGVDVNVNWRNVH